MKTNVTKELWGLIKSVAVMMAVFVSMAFSCQKDPILGDDGKQETEKAAPTLSVSEKAIKVYDAEWGQVASFPIRVKDADELTAETTFDAKVDFELIDKNTDGSLNYMVSISQAENMLPYIIDMKKKNWLKIIATNEAGKTNEDIEVSRKYCINPFSDEGAGLQIDTSGYNMVKVNGTIVKEITGSFIVVGSDKMNIEVVEGGEWITPKAAYRDFYRETGEGGTTFRLHFAANPDPQPRVAKIRFCDDDGIMSFEGEFRQERGPLTIEETLEKERLAMLALYNACGGTDRWSVKVDYSKPVTNKWPGIHEISSEGFVRSIQFSPDYGSLPEEIGDLTHCWEFKLIDSEISGPIPERIRDMKSLTSFQVTGKNGVGLEGRLEDSTFKEIIHQMKYLALDDCNLTGGVPEWLGDMPEYGKFWIEGNRLEGKVPEKVQNHPWWNMENLNINRDIYPTYGSIMMEQQPGYILYL